MSTQGGKMRVIIVIMVTAMVVWGQEATEADSREEAKRIWELAIKAKGGREKLHAVRNMVITSTGDARPVLFIKKKKRIWSKKKYKDITVSFYLLPDKWWMWIDDRPGIFGLNMIMENYETMKEYRVSDGGPFIDEAGNPKERGIVEDIEPNRESNNKAMLVTRLLETKWVQPKVEGVASGKVGRKKVDVIQTKVFNDRLDFMFDKKTHLLLRTVYYYYDKVSKTTGSTGRRYGDYVEVDGIMLPTKVTVESSHTGDSTSYKTYQINVEYNEDLFKKPPLPIEEAMDAWKKDWKPSTNKKENR